VSVSPCVPEFLFKKLTYWHRAIVWDDNQHKRVASGERRELYRLQTYVDATTSQPAQMLVTMPGFVYRLKQLLAGDGWQCQVLDCRTPPPVPNIAAAMVCLRPYQKECVYVALKSGGGIVACPVGWGKCVSPRTPIMYANGVVREIATVQLGDMLMGDDSTPRKVLERIDGFGPMYRITPINGEPFEVADHHILCLVKSGTGKRDRHPDGHIVAITVADYLTRSTNFKRSYKLYRVAVEFEHTPIAVEPYYMGLWLGDGTWNCPTVTSVDPEIITYMYTYARRLKLDVTSHGTPAQYRIMSHDWHANTLLANLRKYGLIRSKIKRIPADYLINSRTVRLELLAGLLDSDGSLNAGTDFDYTGTNRLLVQDVAALAQSLGFRVHATQRHCTGFGKTVEAYRLRITGPTHLIPTRVARKQARVRRQIKNCLRTGFTVTKIADGRYVGVRLDGNMRHLLGDCTVLHNTHIMAAIIRAFSHEQLKLRGTPTVIVAAPEKDITAKNYTVLQQALPDRDVGLVMSGHKKFSNDVQVITLNSLHLVDPSEVGLLLVDEVHAAATAVRTEDLLSMRMAIRYGFSATPAGRFDGADMVTEGLFGPVVYRRTYQQGVQDGALVPIKVFWLPSPHPDCGLDTYYAYSKREALYRHAVDRNSGQNKLITDIVQRTPNKHQLLCIMQHVDHMNRLAPAAGPAVTYVHAVTSASDLVARGFRNILAVSPKQRKAVYDGMNDGSIRKVMSTYVYKQGVDFPALSVIVNAGGGGSSIVAEQIPGRESRNIEDKFESYLVDFHHPWDVVTDEKGKKKPGPVLKDDNARRSVYEDVGFEQVWLESVDQLPFMDTEKTT